jgi:hypothetical protein
MSKERPGDLPAATLTRDELRTLIVGAVFRGIFAFSLVSGLLWLILMIVAEGQKR